MNFKVYFALAIAAVVGLFIATTFEWPSVATVQSGYRGVGMEQVYNRLALETKVAATTLPETIDPTEPAGQKASEVYQNVQVLGDVDANEFIRTMSAMTAWVSPEQGCAYCHNVENMADDSMYTHKVSRRMLQMTRHVNADWQNHVGTAGVTCYTCHRGQNVPANIWFTDPGRAHAPGMAGNPAGQNAPAPTVGFSSLPNDPFTPFLGGDSEIRLASTTALPNGNRTSIKQAEWTYGLMMHMSQSLGVNCTFCHNSRSFSDWSQSSPQRLTSWHGIRMVRDLNVAYLDPLQPVYPPHRLGSLGDAPKANCATCHQGASKPLYGFNMLKDYPALMVTREQAAATGQPVQPVPLSGSDPATQQPRPQ